MKKSTILEGLLAMVLFWGGFFSANLNEGVMLLVIIFVVLPSASITAFFYKKAVIREHKK